jgi:hypothetical protein
VCIVERGFFLERGIGIGVYRGGGYRVIALEVGGFYIGKECVYSLAILKRSIKEDQVIRMLTSRKIKG